MRGACCLMLGTILGLAACGGSGGTSASDAGHDARHDSAMAMVTYMTGTFDPTASPCITGTIKGFSTDPSKSDPQCTLVEHPGDGAAPVTLGACLDNNLTPPCWAPTGCAGDFAFTLNFSTPPPAGATFSYQCTVCPTGSSC
jgi:hypothetical protein